LIIRLRGHNETHLSTVRNAEEANPWFSSSHENHGGCGCYQSSPRQGTSPPGSIAAGARLNSRDCIIRFQKNKRLHKAEEFSSVIRFKCSARSEFLQVFAKPNGLLHPRLGLIIAGKIERLAVNRNRVKRVLREAFRARQRDLAGLDLVVRLRCRVSHNNSSRIAGEAEKLMIQLQRCRG
jgi:ribonuclease P protein component